MQYGKIARGCGQETNIAQGEAECYIRIEIMPECFFPLHKQQCFNWFIVLVFIVYYEGASPKCNGDGSLSKWCSNYTPKKRDYRLVTCLQLMVANSSDSQ